MCTCSSLNHVKQENCPYVQFICKLKSLFELYPSRPATSIPETCCDYQHLNERNRMILTPGTNER
jgi:hypothetical protein